MSSNLGDPKNLRSRPALLQDARTEIKEAADNLYYAAKILVFCSHGSASRVAELADQVLVEIKKLEAKN
jgi:hypothetical protein